MHSSKGSSESRDQIHVSYVSMYWQVGSLPLASPGKPLSGIKLVLTYFFITLAYKETY